MISVCMAAYNGEKFIKEQINSILNQLGTNDELIISDDGSTDDTLNIIGSCRDPRIKLFHNKLEHGVIHNFENALKHASGQYIFLSDQDDLWHPQKINCILRELQKGYSLVLCDATVINESGSIVHPSFYTLNHSNAGLVHNIIKNSYIGCSMAFHRNLLKLFLPFPERIAMHDMWIGLMVELLRLPHTFIPEKLHFYRRHSHNVTGNIKNSLSVKFRLRFFTLFEAVRRILQQRQRAYRIKSYFKSLHKDKKVAC